MEQEKKVLSVETVNRLDAYAVAKRKFLKEKVYNLSTLKII